MSPSRRRRRICRIAMSKAQAQLIRFGISLCLKDSMLSRKKISGRNCNDKDERISKSMKILKLCSHRMLMTAKVRGQSL
jgi:hypothetical protein